jgi:hypothetical protein
VRVLESYAPGQQLDVCEDCFGMGFVPCSGCSMGRHRRKDCYKDGQELCACRMPLLETKTAPTPPE